MGDLIISLQVSAIAMGIVFGVLALLMVVIGVMRQAFMVASGKRAAASARARTVNGGVGPAEDCAVSRTGTITGTAASGGGRGVARISVCEAARNPQGLPSEVVSAIMGAVTCYLESEAKHQVGETKGAVAEAGRTRRLKSLKTIKRIAGEAWAITGRQALMEQAPLRKVS